MEKALEFTAALAVLAFLVLQLVGALLTCAVAGCVALALPAHCRAGMQQWLKSLWRHAFSVDMVCHTWKTWLTCHPAEAWLACAGSASLSTGLLVLGLSAVADSMALRWCSTAPLGFGILLLAAAIIGAWAKILRSCEADYAALAIPFDMAAPAGFKYQPPQIDARNPDAITFVVESDPPQLSLGLNIPRKLELKLMAIDYWQQAAWAQHQLHDRAARKAYLARALKNVQAVVRQVQKQQAAAAGTGNAREQLDGAGGDEAWPVVVLPSPRKPCSPPRRIQIQGPVQGAPAAIQLQHVPQHPSATGSSRAGGSDPVAPPAGDPRSPSAAATAPGTGERRTLLQEGVPERGGAGAASAKATEGSGQAAEAASGSAKQPSQAAGAGQQQPAQAGAVVVPDAASQAAVEAKVRAAMAHQMEQVGVALQAMQEDTRLTTESVSRQMGALQGELQQATQAGQELRSLVARQQEATQQLQQTVRSQALDLSRQQDDLQYSRRVMQSLEADVDAVSRDVKQLQQGGRVDVARVDVQEACSHEAGQELHSLVARQQKATQQLQQTVRSQALELSRLRDDFQYSRRVLQLQQERSGNTAMGHMQEAYGHNVAGQEVREEGSPDHMDADAEPGPLRGCIAELEQHVLELERREKEQAEEHQASEQRLQKAEGLLQLAQVGRLSLAGSHFTEARQCTATKYVCQNCEQCLPGALRRSKEQLEVIAASEADVGRVQPAGESTASGADQIATLSALLQRQQACTARVLMSSLASQAQTGELQHQVQLAVKQLRKLQALADAGDCGLAAAVQEVDVEGLARETGSLTATPTLSSGALEAAAAEAEGLGSVLEQVEQGRQPMMVQERLQWSPEMVHDALAQLSNLVRARNDAEREAAVADAAANDVEWALEQLQKCSRETDDLMRKLVRAIVPDELNTPCPKGGVHLPTLRRVWHAACPSGVLTFEEVCKLTERHSVTLDWHIEPERVWAELHDMVGGHVSEGITLRQLRQSGHVRQALETLLVAEQCENGRQIGPHAGQQAAEEGGGAAEGDVVAVEGEGAAEGDVVADWAAQEQGDEAAEGQTLTRGPAFARLLAAGHERDAALGVSTAPPACGNDWRISAVRRDHNAAGDTGSRQGQATTGKNSAVSTDRHKRERDCVFEDGSDAWSPV